MWQKLSAYHNSLKKPNDPHMKQYMLLYCIVSGMIISHHEI